MRFSQGDGRTRESIGAIRHVFLEAGHDGPTVLARMASRADLPEPSYVLHSSPGRAHIFWRVTGFGPEQVEVQRQLARELDTDPAATSRFDSRAARQVPSR